VVPKIIQIFKIKDLRNKIFFVLGVFVVYRLMANIPIAGIDKVSVANFLNQFQAFHLLGAFTGGSIDTMSIVMLGLGPYITAIIIFQLLTMISLHWNGCTKKKAKPDGRNLTNTRALPRFRWRCFRVMQC